MNSLFCHVAYLCVSSDSVPIIFLTTLTECCLLWLETALSVKHELRFYV